MQQYERALTPEQALADDVVLAYAMNGRPLLPQHGFPLRLVVPGWYGMTNVKWLSRITVLNRAFEGYQQAPAYRLRQASDELGDPVTTMAPRSLMVPPGIPNFSNRERFLDPGPVTLTGRAWSGRGSIERVEVSVDGGHTWADAQIGEQVGPHAWRGWSFEWIPAAAGVYELCCRATDSAGNTQPLEPPWNLGGYANNEVQRVPVTVTGGGET